MAFKPYKSVVPDRPEFPGWKYFTDLGDGVHAFCVDMLLWWKDHSEAFPLLAFLVRVVFSVPAASSISAAGSVISQRRGRLNPEKVEDILTIKLNLALLREYGKWNK